MQIRVGSQLGRYEILAPLGAGGMGEVFRARDERLGRDVALKALPAKLSEDKDALARFDREARALAKLTHPNILAVHDVDLQSTPPFVVTELLEGETLRQRLDRGALPWRDAVELAAAIAEGLAAAHEKCLVHRDLKPENVFLTKDGRVKILDFGLVQESCDGPPDPDSDTFVPGKTSPGVMMGTVGYMSPEQVRGKGVGNATDIFALGCILHEMLTGKRLFTRETSAETLAAILKEDAPSLTDSGVRAPGELDRIVRHCLEKKAQSRFHSARDLAFDLRTILTNPGATLPDRPVVWRDWRLWAGTLAAAALVAVGLGLVRDQEPAARADATPATAALAPVGKSVVVLPFHNIGGDDQAEYFSDGVTEEITAQLSRIKDLRVISKGSALKFKDSGKSPKEIAAELGVATILEGSVRRSGDRIRVTGTLIDARTESNLWSDTYEGSLQDVFAIQTDVALQIAQALRATMTAEEREHLGGRGTRDPEAYSLYLQGRHAWNRRTEEGFRQAEGLFTRSTERDPAYAAAWAGLADTYSLMSFYHIGGKVDYLAKAGEAAEKALALDPGLAEAHTSKAMVLANNGKDDQAEAGFKRAIALNPGYATAHHWYATYLLRRGRNDEALQQIDLAIETDPLSTIILVAKGTILEQVGRMDEAEATVRRAIALDPSFVKGHGILASILVYARKYDEAVEESDRALAVLPDDVQPMLTKATALAWSGKMDEAGQVLDQAEALIRKNGPENLLVEIHSARTMLLAMRGEKDAARASLRKLLKEVEAVSANLQGDNMMTPQQAKDFYSAPILILVGDEDEAFAALRRVVLAKPETLAEWERSPILDPWRDGQRFKDVKAEVEQVLAKRYGKPGK